VKVLDDSSKSSVEAGQGFVDSSLAGKIESSHESPFVRRGFVVRAGVVVTHGVSPSLIYPLIGFICKKKERKSRDFPRKTAISRHSQSTILLPKVQFERPVKRLSKPFFPVFQGFNRGQFQPCFLVFTVRSAEGRKRFG
jgi:hypothetical protein